MKTHFLNRNLQSVLLLILIFASFFTCVHLFKPGFPKTDDGTSMVIRGSAFHQSIRDGHFPVRWLSRLNENYGYPVTNFLYPIPFYLAEPFRVLGLSSLDAIKAVFILSSVASGVGMYWWLCRLATPLPAFIASLIYLLAPYRLADMYVRGSLGEVVSLGILPFVFLFSDLYLKKRRLHHLVLASLLLSLLIAAHNTLALFFVPLVSGYWLVKSVSKPKATYSSLLAVGFFLVLAISQSAYFWLPALADLPHTRSASIQISRVTDHFGTVFNLVSDLGVGFILMFILSIKFRKDSVVALMQTVFIIGLIFQLSVSEPVWNFLSLDKFIQFPFRFLAINIFSGSALTALALSKIKQFRIQAVVSVIVVALAIVSAVPILTSVTIDQFAESFFDTNFDTTTNQREFTPSSVRTDPTTFAALPFEIHGNPGQYQLTNSYSKTQETYLQLIVEDNIAVTFHTHYFPGWLVYVDDNLIKPEILGEGTMRINLTPGDRGVRDVKLIWQETPIRNFGNKLSGMGLFLSVSYLIFVACRYRKRPSIGVLCLMVVGFVYLASGYTNLDLYKSPFNADELESKYLNSQWIDPDSKQPLGDHGLYAWAGWSYVHGTNPILINAEMPPLGKYLIGLGLMIFNNLAVVGTIFSLGFLVALYFLGMNIIKDKYLSLIPVALVSTERIFISSIPHTMLDSIQLIFLCLFFTALIRAEKKPVWFVVAALMLGGVLSTKFYAGGLLVLISVVMFYLTTRRFKQLQLFLVSLPLAGLVHLLSYVQYLIQGGSFRGYLGTQKFIYEFYRQGTTRVPLFSYWGLVFLNQWRVWWGPVWGEFYTIRAKEWQITWPIGAGIAFFLVADYLRKVAHVWNNSKVSVPIRHLLTSWLLTYAIFLSLIGGWPHYLLLFLPFAYILGVRLVLDHQKDILRLARYVKVSKMINKNNKSSL